MTGAAAVAGSAGITRRSPGAEGVHLPWSDRLLRGLVRTDRTAFSERDVRLNGAVLDVGTGDPRAAVRIIYIVVHLYSSRQRFVFIFKVAIVAGIVFVAIAVVVIKILRVWVWFGLRFGSHRAQQSQPNQ